MTSIPQALTERQLRMGPGPEPQVAAGEGGARRQGKNGS